MDHSPGFLKLVAEAKKHVNEISVAEARAKLAANPKVVLLDVREDHEWQAGHAAEAVHLGKGILERDLEKLYPDAQYGNHHVLRRRLPLGADVRRGAKNGLSQSPFAHRRLQRHGSRGLADVEVAAPENR